jgi:SWI/SNF-related matrix-associated actin-dependent regulator of chromatin subfamily A3
VPASARPVTYLPSSLVAERTHTEPTQSMNGRQNNRRGQSPAAPPMSGPALQDTRKRKQPPRDNCNGQVSSTPPIPIAGPSNQGDGAESPFEDEDNSNEISDELYCTMSTNAVGIQYYTGNYNGILCFVLNFFSCLGLVGSGEEVILKREPHNHFDRNAIQVLNISRVQVGHLPRNVALRLAPLLDRRLVTVDGVIRDGNMTNEKKYTLSMTLRIYGASDKRNQLEPLLIWATPGQNGFNRPNNQATRSANAIGVRPAQGARASNSLNDRQQEVARNAAELRQMISTLEKVSDEQRRNSVLDRLCSIDDVLSAPEHPDPPSIANGQLHVDLMKHQVCGFSIDRIIVPTYGVSETRATVVH